MNTIPAVIQPLGLEGCRIRISQHAIRRAKERLHWHRDTISRMANRALTIGLSPSDTVGALKFYLLSKVGTDEASCPFLYGEHVYIFKYSPAENVIELLTVYRATHKLLKVLVYQPLKSAAYTDFGMN